MLKIKDNVDLKELEKYGFIHNLRYEYRPNSRVLIDDYRTIHLTLYINPSLIPMEVFDESIIKAYIDDLIKDNLVEEVDE